MEIQCSVSVLYVFKPRKGLFLFPPADIYYRMIKFRNLFEQLVEDLSPAPGHMGVRWDADLLKYVDIDNPRLAEGLMSFLKQNDIKYDQSAFVPTPDDYIGSWIQQYVPRQYIPEVLYFCLTKFPDTIDLQNPSFAKEGNYRFMAFDRSGEGMMDLVFVDDGAGQALGMMMVDYEEKLEHFKRHFKRQPVQVHLSMMVPSVRGTGEGHKMYSLLLNKFGTIMSDSTLFEGSFAMWDTTIRQSAPYSGVTAFSDRLVYANTKGDVYTMSIPNAALDRFWASKTIQPWVLEMSKALSKLNAKTTLVANLSTRKSLPLVVDILDKVSENFTIKELLKYLEQGAYDWSYLYNMKSISNPSILLILVSQSDGDDVEGIIKVAQKGSNLDITLL